MGDQYPAEDIGVVLLERRWFAAGRAAVELEAECDVLRRALTLTQLAWRDARARLAELEALREVLGDELSSIGEPELPHVIETVHRSAA